MIFVLLFETAILCEEDKKRNITYKLHNFNSKFYVFANKHGKEGSHLRSKKLLQAFAQKLLEKT